MRRFILAMAVAMAAWLAIDVAQAISAIPPATAPSVLVPTVRADQAPVTPTYRSQTALNPKVGAVTPTITPFRLARIEITGSSIPKGVLSAAYAPWLGRVVDRADLEAITRALSQVYAAHSDVALFGIDIPSQGFDGGVLRIQAVEGFIQGARVTARGRRGSDERLLARYLQRLVAERPLRRSSLERYAALIRDIAGLNPTLAFEPAGHPGAFILLVATAQRPAEVSFGTNNRGTAFLGRTQVDLDLALHSLIRQGDDTHLTFAFPTQFERFQYYALTHSEPIAATGASVTLSAAYLKTRPDFEDLNGHAKTLGLSLLVPILRRNDQSLYGTLGLDGVNSDNALLGDEISNDHIRTARLGASYVRQDPRYFLLVNGSANFGIDTLGARVLSPAISDVRGSKYTAKLTANIALPCHLVLRLDGAAQYSADRLAGSEQFALGGDEFGRAYEAAIISGDRGGAGSAELAWKASAVALPMLKASEAYVFADDGSVRRLARPFQPASSQQLASVGGGARLAIAAKAVVQLEAARGLLNPVPTEDHESWRAVFSVKSTF